MRGGGGITSIQSPLTRISTRQPDDSMEHHKRFSTYHHEQLFHFRQFLSEEVRPTGQSTWIADTRLHTFTTVCILAFPKCDCYRLFVIKSKLYFFIIRPSGETMCYTHPPIKPPKIWGMELITCCAYTLSPKICNGLLLRLPPARTDTPPSLRPSRS